MLYKLVASSDEEVFTWNETQLRTLFLLGILDGWVPKGTVAPEGWKGHWRGSYNSWASQKVYSSDAIAWAKALREFIEVTKSTALFGAEGEEEEEEEEFDAAEDNEADTLEEEESTKKVATRDEAVFYPPESKEAAVYNLFSELYGNQYLAEWFFDSGFPYSEDIAWVLFLGGKEYSKLLLFIRFLEKGEFTITK